MMAPPLSAPMVAPARLTLRALVADHLFDRLAVKEVAEVARVGVIFIQVSERMFSDCL
jgi:hypothetical protein